MPGTHETIYAVRALPVVTLGIVDYMDYEGAWIFAYPEEQYAVRLKCQSTSLFATATICCLAIAAGREAGKISAGLGQDLPSHGWDYERRACD